MADILKLPKEIMEFMVNLDKKLMKQFYKEKDAFMDYLRRHKLTPSDFNGAEADFPLGQAYSSPHGMFIANERLKKHGIPVHELYKRNSLRYRSDEFTNIHDGKHILFAGCSVTYGDSLPLHLIWPRIVYDRISKNEKTSGFFNLGKPGGSIIDIMLSITAYIDRYGRPDVIFILFPDKIRDITQFNVNDDEDLTNKIYILSVQLYRLLRDMMLANEGMIFSTSWADESCLSFNGDNNNNRYYPISLEETFQQFLREDLTGYIYNFENENPDHEFKEFIIKAADLAHPGIAEHEFYANLLYNSYYEKVSQRA